MTEMSIRERVARAISPTLWSILDSHEDAEAFGMPERRRANSLRQADAAIAAMREPTSLMVERGHAKAFAGAEAPECYRDMIDAALSEKAP